MAKIIPFPSAEQAENIIQKQETKQQICAMCNKEPTMPDSLLCDLCASDILDDFDDSITNAINQLALYLPPKPLIRLLINHIYLLQKGEYHNGK